MSIYNYSNFDRFQLNNSNLQKQQDYKELLFEAISRSDVDGLKQLLNEIGENQKSEILNTPNARGEIPLHAAVSSFSSNAEIVSLLLKNGADINARNERNQTPFEKALTAFDAKPEIFATLIDHGASVNGTDSNGTPFLHLAVSQFSPNPSVISLLLQKGADPHAVDSRGLTALENAINAYSPNVQVVEKLIEGGSDINCLLSDGSTMLHKTIFPANIEIAKLLIQNGIDINKPDNLGRTTLDCLIQMRTPDLELIKLLISYKINPEQMSRGLKDAINSSNVEVVKVILENTPDVNREEIDKLLFKICKEKQPNIKIAELLIEHGANPSQIDEKGVSCSWLLKSVGWKGSSINDNYDTEFEFRKLLANMWGLAGKTELEGHAIDLEGFYDGSIGVTQLLRLFELFVDDPSLDDMTNLNPFNRLLNESNLNAQGSPEEIQKKYEQGLPISFFTGWEGHAIHVIFYKDHMMICNRGSGSDALTSTKVFKIDRKFLFTKENIQTIIDRNLSPERGMDFFYEILPRELGLNSKEKDPLSEFFNTHFKQKNQKVGNCWWVSPKASIFALYAMKNIEDTLDLPVSNRDELWEKMFKQSQTMYKQFSDFTRIQILKEYISRSPDSAGRDSALVGRAEDKMQARKIWHYSFDKSELTDSLNEFKKLQS